jgi:hypothetical protein
VRRSHEARSPAADLAISETPNGFVKAADRMSSSSLTHLAIRFQLALFWSTTLRSPEPARATGGRPTFARSAEGRRATYSSAMSVREGCPP